MVQICGLIIVIFTTFAGLAKESSRPWMTAAVIFCVIGIFYQPSIALSGICEVIGIYKLLFGD